MTFTIANDIMVLFYRSLFDYNMLNCFNSVICSTYKNASFDFKILVILIVIAK